MAGPMKPGAGLRGKDNTGRIMRRKNQAILGVISAAADAVLIFLSYLGAVAIRFDVLDGHVSLALNSPRFYSAAGVYALLIVCVYAVCHLYQPFRRLRPGRDAGVVLTVNALGTLAMTVLMCILNLVLDPIFWGTPREAVLRLLVPAIIPFNLSKAGINSLITFLIYKRVSKLIHRAEDRSR